MVIAHGPLLEELIKRREFLWKYNSLTTEDGQQFHETMSSAGSTIKLFMIIGYISVCVHSVAPLFVEKLDLPHACWIPRNNDLIRKIIYIFEVITYNEIIILIVFFNGFYLLMCTELKIQFQILCKKIHSMRIDKHGEQLCWQEIKSCSSYHNLLLQ